METPETSGRNHSKKEKQTYMNIQAKKIHFLEEYLRLNDESIIDKLEETLRRERKKELSEKMKPLTKHDLQQKLERSEKDIAEGNLYVQEDVETYFKKKGK